MTRRIKSVCVIGAGLAGLACATAAAARGKRVDVFEAAVTPPMLSAHVEVVPNMLRDLVALGVGEECVRAGFAYHDIDVIDCQGRAQFTIPTERLAGPRYPAALGIKHDELHRILANAAADRGAKLHWGCVVSRVERRGDLVRTRLTSGDEATSDLVILAGGAKTQLRAALFPGAELVDDLAQAWWYTLVQRPVELDRPCLILGAAGRKVFMVPVCTDVAGLALIEPFGEAAAATSDSPAAQMRGSLAPFPGLVHSAARQLRSDHPVALRRVRSSLLPAPWHRDHVLAVGECAHSMPPHFGQAGAQALEDATVLADLLANAHDRAALEEAFTERRFERARRVHEIASTAARWDLSPECEADLRELMARLTRTVAQPA
jgi:2-polyprenyl-6-methoxyphenol hydroxylase-like FAD-dependent oxidoreductase